MRLIITRHGKTIQNESGIIQGRTPGQLSELGHEQAKSFGKRISKEKIDIIYCSPSSRCRETLSDILNQFENKPEVKFIDALQERDFGELTGLTLEPIHYDLLENHTDKSQKMGIESVEQLFQRSKEFIDQIRYEDTQKTVFVLTHSNNIRAILMYLFNKSFNEILDTVKVKNCGYTEFEIRSMSDIKQISLDDVSHLEDTITVTDVK